MNEEGYKGFSKGGLIRVKTPIEGYYSSYSGKPKFFLTPDITATIVNPKVVSVRGHIPYFCLVEFFSPITKKVENTAIFNFKNIIRR